MLTRFKQLTIGQSFDFVDDTKPSLNSFYLRCTKTSSRTYQDEKGAKHRIGSIKAKVHHIEQSQ